MAHQEFDDDSFKTEPAFEVTFYDSDEESGDDMESYNAELAKKEAYKNRLLALQQERDDAYAKRIASQLANSGEALAGKLNWCSMPKPIVVEPKKVMPPPPKKAMPPKKATKRFGKAVPLDIDIRVCNSSFLMTAQPPQPSTSTSICKYIISGSQCPFGERCKFSHVFSQQDKQQRKLQKFRMCRNVESCRFQNDCIYAHSERELQENILTCHAGVNCRKVRKQNDEYVNIANDRKCMFLHPNERIRNFIKRTA